MVYNLWDQIAYLSTVMTLEPGGRRKRIVWPTGRPGNLWHCPATPQGRYRYRLDTLRPDARALTNAPARHWLRQPGARIPLPAKGKPP